MLEDDKEDQDILDQHVSRIWSDMTPHRSPGNLSPCTQFQRRKPHEIVFVAGGSESQTFYLITQNSEMFFRRRAIFDAHIKINARLKHAQIQQVGQHKH